MRAGQQGQRSGNRDRECVGIIHVGINDGGWLRFRCFKLGSKPLRRDTPSPFPLIPTRFLLGYLWYATYLNICPHIDPLDHSSTQKRSSPAAGPWQRYGSRRIWSGSSPKPRHCRRTSSNQSVSTEARTTSVMVANYLQMLSCTRRSRSWRSG